MAGYIKLHRKLLNWGWYGDPYTKVVFLHLLLVASYEDNEFRGKSIKKGQAVVGRKQLAKDLGLSEQSVRTALNHLKSTNEITIESTNKYSVITIVKWADYQLDDGAINQQANQQANQQLTNNQPATNHTQEGKKLRNKESNRAFKPPTLDEVKAYCLERKNKVDPEAFIDFYESKGWMVGKNKMKDWQSAVRNWERREAGRPQTTSKAPIEPPKYKEFKPEPKRDVVQMPEEVRDRIREIF